MALYDSKLAAKVHKDNVESRRKIDAEFAQAEADKKRIEARHRSRLRCERNREQYGCARRPPEAAKRQKVAATPQTDAGLAGSAGGKTKARVCG